MLIGYKDGYSEYIYINKINYDYFTFEFYLNYL